MKSDLPCQEASAASLLHLRGKTGKTTGGNGRKRPPRCCAACPRAARHRAPQRGHHGQPGSGQPCQAPAALPGTRAQQIFSPPPLPAALGWAEPHPAVTAGSAMGTVGADTWEVLWAGDGNQRHGGETRKPENTTAAKTEGASHCWPGHSGERSKIINFAEHTYTHFCCNPNNRFDLLQGEVCVPWAQATLPHGPGASSRAMQRAAAQDCHPALPTAASTSPAVKEMQRMCSKTSCFAPTKHTKGEQNDGDDTVNSANTTSNFLNHLQPPARPSPSSQHPVLR